MEDECPEAKAEIDVLLSRMKARGPSPPGYDVKALGANKGGLWQASLKVKKRQIRLLFAPYGEGLILVFRIHKKGSPQEQRRAYELAMSRKRAYEIWKAEPEPDSDRSRTIN